MKKSLLTLAAFAMMAGSSDAALYLVGQPAGNWSPQVGIEMEEVDGGWQWSGTVASDEYFAFATELMDSDDWDTFNANYRVSPDADGVFAVNGEYTLHVGGDQGAFRGTGSKVTYFVKEVDGVYTLKVTEHNLLYIIGQPYGQEWSPMKGIRMENVEDGWKWIGFTAENEYFAFATDLLDSEDWGTFNANYRLSPEADGVAAEPGEYALHLGAPEGSFHGIGMTAEYYVKLIDGEYSVTITEYGDQPVTPEFPSDAVWSVVGEFNGWGAEPDFKMTQIRDGVWKATMYDFSGMFKFRANDAWEYNLGSSEKVVDEEGNDIGYDIDMDGSFSLLRNGGNFIIPEEVEEVTFELDVNNMTLTVDGLTPSFLALRGSFIDWGFEWSYLFQEVETDVYMLYLDGVDSDWQFKIADQDWTEIYTTSVPNMKAGEIYPIDPDNAENMGVDNVYTEVTMILNLEDGYFCFYGEVGSGVATAEIADGKARYFNLQGCEVSNPSNGVFIRVVNGKSEKVTVK